MGGSESKWEAEEQRGRVVLITGGNSGIGYIVARELGKMGAEVHITARDRGRGLIALDNLVEEVPEGSFHLEDMDLSKLVTVREFAEKWNSREDPRLDTLINNAGIMNTPTRELSEDGFEMQFATNHLGHFALTGLLLEALRKSDSPRIVNVSSIMADKGRATDGAVDFKKDEGYVPETVYAETKLTNLFFTLELSKRFPEILCLSSHPGVTATNLFKHSYSWAKCFMQSPEDGAVGTIRAAAEQGVQTNWYFGPPGMRGAVKSNLDKAKHSQDEDKAKLYWNASIVATGVDYGLTNQGESA